MFSSFPSCSQMPVLFYHSVVHRVGFFICYVLFVGHSWVNNGNSVYNYRKGWPCFVPSLSDYSLLYFECYIITGNQQSKNINALKEQVMASTDTSQSGEFVIGCS